MADASQAALALAYVCAGIVYPGGLSQASVTGRQTTVRRGWLLPSDIFSAESVRASVDFITVTMAKQGVPDLAEPLGRPWRVLRTVSPTVSVEQVGDAVRIVFPSSGAAAGVIGLWYGEAGASSAYAVMSGDTAQGVASALASGLSGAAVDGDTVSVPGAVVQGRIAGYGQSVRVTRRQSQRYRVSIWTGDASVREMLSSALDTSLAAISWIAMLDGRQAQLKFAGVEDVDTMRNQALYRRDYFYDLVFDTLDVQWTSDMLFGIGTVSDGERVFDFGTAAPALSDATVSHALEAMAAAEASAASGDYADLTVDKYGAVVAAT